jgi:hypothetical protein
MAIQSQGTVSAGNTEQHTSTKPHRGVSLPARDLLVLAGLALAAVGVTSLWLVPALEAMGAAANLPKPGITEFCGQVVVLPNGLEAVVVCEDDAPRGDTP